MAGSFAVAALAAAALGLGAQPADAQASGARPPVLTRAEQCLRRNVDHVVAAERDLQAAASFLVTYACAAEVTAAARYQRNAAYVQMFASMFKAAAPPAQPLAAGKPAPPALAAGFDFHASVDPETGELVPPKPAPGAPASPAAGVLPLMSNVFNQVAPDTVPVDLRKLAGDLVLAAHEQQAARAR